MDALVKPSPNGIDHFQIVKQRRRFITLLVSVFVFLSLIAMGFLSGFLKMTPAYAKGNARIVVVDNAMEIVFTSATTSDSARKVDAGLDKHVGKCTAAVHNGVINFSVLKGYPGYQCTLTIGMANRGDHEADWQLLDIRTPPGLSMKPVNDPTGSTFEPDEKLSVNFILLVLPEAGENAEYPVSIDMVFIKTPISD